jgi:hypothetical protein
LRNHTCSFVVDERERARIKVDCSKEKQLKWTEEREEEEEEGGTSKHGINEFAAERWKIRSLNKMSTVMSFF